jgi:hypothetical protein
MSQRAVGSSMRRTSAYRSIASERWVGPYLAVKAVVVVVVVLVLVLVVKIEVVAVVEIPVPLVTIGVLPRILIRWSECGY